MTITMELRDGSTYPIERADIVKDRLEIDFKDRKIDELESILSNPALTSQIKLYNGENECFSILKNWSIYCGVLTLSGVSTALLAQTKNPIDVKLADVQSDILNLKTMVESTQSVAAIQTARIMAQTFNDTNAIQVKGIYPLWEDLVAQRFIAESAGYKFTYKDELYKTAQNNLEFESHWIPGEGTESLFTRIDLIHAGTFSDPIPAKKNMEYAKGKYYIEDDILYQMTREGLITGEKIVLQYLPSELVGSYFTIIEKEG